MCIFKKIKNIYEWIVYIKKYIQKTSPNRGILYPYFKMLYMLYVYLLLRLKNLIWGAVQLNKRVYIVKYYKNNEEYYFPIIKRGGPKNKIVKCICDDKDNTNFIYNLSGPNCDFYKIKLRVSDLGYSRMNITLEDDREINLSSEDILSVL